MWWLQSETNYTFNGDAPVSGLTRHELDLLMLGHLVTKEQQDDEASSGSSSSVRRQKQRLRQGHRQSREDVFGDLGIQ